MSLSTGNAFSSSTQYHSFVTNDPIMVELGLGTFDLDSINNALLEIKEMSDEIGDEEFYQNYIIKANGSNGLQILFTMANSSQWIGSKFNKSSGTFSTITKSGQDIIGIVSDFEKNIEALYTEHQDAKDAKSNVDAAKRWIEDNVSNATKHSSDRCFVLTGKIFHDSDSHNGESIYTKLYFHIPGDGVDRQERISAQRNSPVISSVATSATGLKYSNSKTQYARDSLHPGLYVKPDDLSGNKVSDLATGPIRLSYNDAIGAWESSQSILARLITPLDAAGNGSFAMPDEDNEGYLKSDGDGAKFYQPTSDYYTGKFRTGLAVPVSTQDGNPHLFGPNIIIDYNKKRIEKIRVVNRSDKSFTAGTLVMCTLIGSEWIVQEFSLASDQSFPTRVGSWTFCKLLANSDCFFRDAGSTEYLWSFGTYEDKARSSWYKQWVSSIGSGEESLLDIHDASVISQENGAGDETFNPSLGYYSASSFDSTDSSYGGRSAFTSLPMIQGNIDKAISDTQGYLFGKNFGPAWGPFFPDGYVSIGPSRTSGTSLPVGVNADKYFSGGAVAYSGNGRDLIADIAINGPYSDDHGSSPILPMDYWQELLSQQSFFNACKTYRQNVYANPTYLSGGTGPGGAMYGWTPSNPNRIHFSPLSAELVASTDKYAAWAKDDRKDMHEFFNSNFPAAGGSTVFDPIFSRFRKSATFNDGSSQSDCSFFDTVTGSCSAAGYDVQLCDVYSETQRSEVTQNPDCSFSQMVLGGCGESTTVTEAGIDPQYDPSTMLEYGCYVINAPLCEPNGIMRFMDEPFNMIGIIAGINRFSRIGGGSVNIETQQYFGIKPNRQVTGQSGSLSILPIGLGTVVGSSAPSLFQYSFNQWGSNTDNYNSCGTTALHCRIFDAWPREDTIWDPRFFSVLHFNPSYPPEGEEQTSVDFQVPTYSNGSIPSAGSAVTGSSDFADLEDWSWDYVRRGKLLTGGGFKYRKRTIGLNFSSVQIANPGSDLDSSPSSLELSFSQYNLEFNAIVSGGQLTGLECTKTDSNGNLTSGEDMDASIFQDSYTDENGTVYTGFIVNIQNAVAVVQGVVRDIIKIDNGPQEHGGSKRLTDGSSGGDDVVEGSKTAEFNLNPNISGEYDAFFFFHNDSTHTVLYGYPSSQVPGFYQYVITTIS